MKKLFLVFAATLTCSSFLAQKKSPVVLDVGKQQFLLDEFEFVYNKNNQLSQSPLSPQEYLDLFTNYKLKVIEAEKQGYDQRESFLKEFTYYRDELAKPYLTDKKAEEQVLAEAYDRLKYEVDASHILVRFPQQMPTPEDTLKAWTRIHELKEMLDKGEAFEDVASKYSEDPSATQNKGRLGYFTGFQMVYPFETAAYQTPVGQVSGIVRTSFGYHMIKVHDKRSSQGEILVAHIMKMFPYNTTGDKEAQAKASIDSIYALIKQGADFGQLARELSEDRQSADNDGQMPWFSTSRMIPEFATPAFALQSNGDVSEPIKTPYGWHIIKRIDKRGVASFDSMKEDLLKRIASDERAFAGQNSVVTALKKRDQFVAYNAAIEPLKNELKTENMTDSLFYVNTLGLNQPVCKFADQTYLQSDFAKYLQDKKWHATSKNEADLDGQFEQFCNARLLDHEKENLNKSQPEYRFLVSEYHDGLLIFDISQAEIWNKAAADTAGLENFFAARRNVYPKPISWEGMVCYCNSDSVYQVVKGALEGATVSDVDSLLAPLSLPVSKLKIEKVKAVKGAKPLVDKNIFNVTDAKVTYPRGYSNAVLVGEIKPETLYELSEIRGQVLSDYQLEVEKKWIESLRSQYQPKVNYKVLKKMKTQAK